MNDYCERFQIIIIPTCDSFILSGAIPETFRPYYLNYQIYHIIVQIMKNVTNY